VAGSFSNGDVVVWSAVTAQLVLHIRACSAATTEEDTLENTAENTTDGEGGPCTGIAKERPVVVNVDVHPQFPVLCVALSTGEMLFYALQCLHTRGVSDSSLITNAQTQ
jgi:hypothetical protein